MTADTELPDSLHPSDPRDVAEHSNLDLAVVVVRPNAGEEGHQSHWVDHQTHREVVVVVDLRNHCGVVGVDLQTHCEAGEVRRNLLRKGNSDRHNRFLDCQTPREVQQRNDRSQPQSAVGDPADASVAVHFEHHMILMQGQDFRCVARQKAHSTGLALDYPGHHNHVCLRWETFDCTEHSRGYAEPVDERSC